MQEIHEPLDIQPRWVKVMADYSSTGLWDSNGANAEEDFVPMSAALKARLHAWCLWYEKNEDYLDTPESIFDYVSFSAEGLAVAKAIKAELPDWTVVYFDEAKMPGIAEGTEGVKGRAIPREEYEYEVTAD
jgi:hypothetical protein